MDKYYRFVCLLLALVCKMQISILFRHALIGLTLRLSGDYVVGVGRRRSLAQSHRSDPQRGIKSCWEPRSHSFRSSTKVGGYLWRVHRKRGARKCECWCCRCF